MNMKLMVVYPVALFVFVFGVQVTTVAAVEPASLAIQFEHAVFSTGNSQSVAEKMLRVADERSDDTLRAQAYIRMAFSLAGQVDSDSERYFNRAAALQTVSDQARLDFLMFGGYVQARELNDLDGGISSLRKAISLARTLENDRAIVLSDIILAELLYFSEQYSEARQLLFRASEFSKALDDEVIESLVNRKLMALLGTLGSFESAIPYAMKQIEFEKKRGNPGSAMAEWILWRAGKERGYVDYLRNKLSLNDGDSSDTSNLKSGAYSDLIRLAFVLRKQSPGESVQYAKSSADHFRAIKHYDKAGWADVVSVMAKANLVEEESYPGLVAEIQQLLADNPLAYNSIQHQYMNEAVADFLRSIGDKDGAFEFQQRETNRLRVNTDRGTSSSSTYARMFFKGEQEHRNKNREIESQHKTISSQQEAARQNSLVRNALIVALGLTVIGLLLARQLSLQRHRKRLQQEVHEKTKRLEMAKEHAEESRDLAMKAVDAKTDFYAQLNHEIRNPLQAIVGFAEVLQLPHNGQDRGSLLDGIRGSAEHLMRLVNNALDMSSIDKGKVEIVSRNFDFHELIRDVGTILSELCEEKKLTFRCDVSLDTPRMVFGDEVKIRQILLNLAMNSIKFTDAGFVRIDVAAKSHASDQVCVSLTVKDSGCGMSERELQTVFDPFSQSANAKVKRTGSGLGLYICKSYCELMGGTLTAESVPDEGSTFFCDLQLQLATEEGEMSSQSDSVIVAKIDKNLRVLVVDDNAIVKDAMSALLGVLGCDYRTADGFGQAKKVLADWIPDLIFLDIHMPEADGYEVATYIRKLESLSQVVVIALTGDAVTQVRDRALQSGFDDFLAKPISTSKLRLAIQKHHPKTTASQVSPRSSV